MNRKDIICMAQETGVTAERVRDLVNFASLVASAEREACAKDEPVAWGVFEGNLHDMFFTQSEAQEMAKLKGTHAEVRPLYAAPQRTEQEQKPMHPEMRKMWEDHFDKCFAESAPQRTWVGLTDEEVWEAYMESPVELDCSTDELYALSRTVEAKLKEKNT